MSNLYKVGDRTRISEAMHYRWTEGLPLRWEEVEEPQDGIVVELLGGCAKIHFDNPLVADAFVRAEPK